MRQIKRFRVRRIVALAFLGFFVLTGICGWAQSGITMSISGKAYDLNKQNSPITGLEITLLGNEDSKITDIQSVKTDNNE